MRSILIDWLIDIHRKFKITEPAIYLAIQIIDKILEKIPVAKHRFQLLGITALFIASKYEDIYPPALSDFAFVCADAYTEEDILLMEANILKELKFSLMFVSPFNLLEPYFEESKFFLFNISLENIPMKARCLIQYLQNLVLISDKMVKFSSSEKSAASIFLASKVLDFDFGPLDKISFDFGLERKSSIVKKCAKEMVLLLSRETKSRLSACKRKFKHEKYMGVSKIQISLKREN